MRAAKIKKAVTLVMLQPPPPAWEPTTRIHAPSQPLMQSPLSRNQTPATPRRARRFFRVRPPTGSPRLADHPAYFGSANLLNCQPFRPSTKVRLRLDEFLVNARYWCSEVEIAVNLLKSQAKSPLHALRSTFNADENIAYLLSYLCDTGIHDDRSRFVTKESSSREKDFVDPETGTSCARRTLAVGIFALHVGLRRLF